ncbi:[NiFe] hydrogenase nickel incorporation-associated protein HypB [Methanosarcina sp. Kolksee]|uniref:[NiFe] hydrogenase nickel incorporation-associated protein HypB n=2 Tax=Methanosarcina TaxID=2207 RepID=A0A0E3Q7L7_9EURY|nr:hydrogenase nickel incorporation protein HypB [Methanosarcina sp. DH1]AKB44862.1 [NiFe] hydrogenase nickel incorporation-associated protein HypB [Methanosarcina vacuolata Z-761]AKB48374.1 [NiFe] hydrogenase nickel incorporation-associated protein HypB [Methanosarcina sp. Kolksee]MCC4767800.1 hydrogenase nickel incorporation protein HypB [Methanosarcina sp. DH1]
MHVIDMGHDVYKANDKVAEKNRKKLDKYQVFSVNVMGAIGSGKTTLIEEAIRQLKDKYRIAVIAGDVIAEMDSSRFRKLDVPTIPVNTGKECHLDAKLVEKALDEIDLSNTDLLLIENVGNLICPVDFKLGEQLRVVIVSVTEGDDIILKHPMIFKTANLAVINKVDIAHAVDVDAEKMRNDILSLNPSVPVILTSKHDWESLETWISFIELGVKKAQNR